MHNPMLIGLGAKARQGKDTVAQTMIEESQGVARRYGFADELKRYCASHHLELLKDFPHPVREPKNDPIYGFTDILQWFGCRMREQSPDYWIKALERRLASDLPEIALITDVRFPNEADWIKAQGGKLVEVLRYNPDGEMYIDAGRDPYHISETALDNYLGWDFVIVSRSGDLAKLREKARRVYREIAFSETASPCER